MRDFFSTNARQSVRRQWMDGEAVDPSLRTHAIAVRQEVAWLISLRIGSLAPSASRGACSCWRQVQTDALVNARGSRPSRAAPCSIEPSYPARLEPLDGALAKPWPVPEAARGYHDLTTGYNTPGPPVVSEPPPRAHERERCAPRGARRGRPCGGPRETNMSDFPSSPRACGRHGTAGARRRRGEARPLHTMLPPYRPGGGVAVRGGREGQAGRRWRIF